MSGKVVFISGANRGIGLELANQLSNNNFSVIAGWRIKESSKQLLKLGNERENLFSFKVDVINENDLRALHDFIDKKFGRLDILFNNAAINEKRDFSLNDLSWDDIEKHLKINLGGMFLSAKYLFPLLQKAEGKIINLSSRLGSISLTKGGSIPYAISKAALNMLTKQQLLNYGNKITSVSVTPGWVKTDMGGSSAPLSVEESVKKLIDFSLKIDNSKSGKFFSADLEELSF